MRKSKTKNYKSIILRKKNLIKSFKKKKRNTLTAIYFIANCFSTNSPNKLSFIS